MKREVASEMTGLLAFETSNYRGGGLLDRPTSRFSGKLRHGRLTARFRPTSTRLAAVLIGQLHRTPFDSHLPYQDENFVRLVVPNALLCRAYSFNSGRCKPATNALLITAAGPRLNAPRASWKTFSALGFSKYCSKLSFIHSALHCISRIYSSSFGPHGQKTAQLCRRNRRVDRITRPTLRVLSNSLAKIIVRQFRSIEIGSRQG